MRSQQAGATTDLSSIIVLDFDLLDDQDNPLTKAAQEVRLRNAGLQLQRELAERRLYRVADPAPAAPLQRDLRLQQGGLYRAGLQHTIAHRLDSGQAIKAITGARNPAP